MIMHAGHIQHLKSNIIKSWSSSEHHVSHTRLLAVLSWGVRQWCFLRRLKSGDVKGKCSVVKPNSTHGSHLFTSRSLTNSGVSCASAPLCRAAPLWTIMHSTLHRVTWGGNAHMDNHHLWNIIAFSMLSLHTTRLKLRDNPRKAPTWCTMYHSDIELDHVLPF